MYSTTVQTYKDARLYVDAPEYGNKLYIEVDDGGWHSIIDGKLHVRAINITYRYEQHNLEDH